MFSRFEHTETGKVLLDEISKLSLELQDSATKKLKQNTHHQNNVNALKVQEEKISELLTVVEQTELERNELIFLNAEVQILREANLKHCIDELNHSNLKSEYEKLERQYRLQSDQLVEIKQKKTIKDDKTDVEKRVENKKTNELRDALHLLDSKQISLKNENERIEKENYRLKNSIMVNKFFFF
jgi:hypothetical protein